MPSLNLPLLLAKPRLKAGGLAVVSGIAALLVFISVLSHGSSQASNDPSREFRLDRLPVLPAFPAAPFASTTRAAADASGAKPWLAAIMVSAKDVQRRALVRSTWLRMYRDVPLDYVFVLGNPVAASAGEDGWADVVAAENRTYGDLVVLDRVYEGSRHANTYKSVEFYRWLAQRPWRNTYAWVSKVDGDSFVDARSFFARYIEPRIAAVANDSGGAGMAYAPTVQRTFIARRCELHGWVFGGGQFYTMSRDLVALLPRLQDLGNWPHPNPDEDIRNAMILKSNGVSYDIVGLPNEEAFDYTDRDARDGTAWARNNRRQRDWTHAVGARAINPHKMKTDAEWMRVAACFDGNGLRQPPAGLE